MTRDLPQAGQPADRVLDDLIAQHLDGGLDPAGQRRLADLLAASADARRTLATYLRLEGATQRLARAGLLGGATAAPAGKPPPATRTAARAEAAVAGEERSRWLWPTSLAIAAGLLVAAVIALPPRRADDPAVADLDRLAEGWLALARDADEARLATAEPFPADDTLGQDAEPTDPPERVAAPPGWLVAALADELANGAVPDEG